jgi:site-specific recombinase XerD
MESNRTCPLLEEYLGYLSTIKGRSIHTIKEYRTDILVFFTFVCEYRGSPITERNFKFADIDFIKSITLNDIYAFIAHYQNNLKTCSGTRARKIVSIRQF